METAPSPPSTIRKLFTKGSAPVIANGKVYVPSLSNRVSVYGLATSQEAEPLQPGVHPGIVRRVFADGNMSAGNGLILESHANGQFVSFTVNVPQAGLYGVRPRHKPNNNRGIWQLDIDGVNQGAAVDGFSSTVQYVELDLGTKQLTAGDHTFRFTVTGGTAPRATRGSRSTTSSWRVVIDDQSGVRPLALGRGCDGRSPVPAPADVASPPPDGGGATTASASR